MKVIKAICIGMFAALLIWLFVSWMDIVTDNCHPNPTHSRYNAFVLMTTSVDD